jgi:hypothetical protein
LSGGLGLIRRAAGEGGFVLCVQQGGGKTRVSGTPICDEAMTSPFDEPGSCLRIKHLNDGLLDGRCGTVPGPPKSV